MEFSSGGGGRIAVDERWYNISSTNAVAGAEDADYGEYVCTVCTNCDTPDQECNEARLTLFIVGAAPVLDKATDNGESNLYIELHLHVNKLQVSPAKHPALMSEHLSWVSPRTTKNSP